MRNRWIRRWWPHGDRRTAATPRLLLRIGTARIRHGYLEIAPDLLPYFTIGVRDDLMGVMAASIEPADSEEASANAGTQMAGSRAGRGSRCCRALSGRALARDIGALLRRQIVMGDLRPRPRFAMERGRPIRHEPVEPLIRVRVLVEKVEVLLAERDHVGASRSVLARAPWEPGTREHLGLDAAMRIHLLDGLYDLDRGVTLEVEWTVEQGDDVSSCHPARRA